MTIPDDEWAEHDCDDHGWQPCAKTFVRYGDLTDYTQRMVYEHLWWEELSRLSQRVAEHVADYRADSVGRDWATSTLEQALDRYIPLERRPPKELTREERERRRMTQSVKTAILDRDNHACQFCGARKRLVVDHILPLTLGGTSDDDNLQTLCHSCNTKKGRKHPDDVQHLRVVGMEPQ